eukprot:NODE_235_length_13458_cov_0.279737.p6 type:complete len:255 gc:universal NODE_235_length_13458_cov_0.279737:1177-1941(+)
MDWLGIDLPFHKLEYLLDSPFNLEVDRLYHLKRLSYQPLALHRVVNSNYFQEFLNLFDIELMNTNQAIYGIQWLAVVCKEPNIASRLAILPFEKMVIHSQLNVKNSSLSLLLNVIKLTVNRLDSSKLSKRMHIILVAELLSSLQSLNGKLEDLTVILDCLANLDFGIEQNNHDVILSPESFKRLNLLLQVSAPSQIKKNTLHYLSVLVFFKSNRDAFYFSSMFDSILLLKEPKQQLDELKSVLSLDSRMKKHFK